MAARISIYGIISVFALKNQLYGTPESPVHDLLRNLYNEIPYQHHQYVALMKELR